MAGLHVVTNGLGAPSFRVSQKAPPATRPALGGDRKSNARFGLAPPGGLGRQPVSMAARKRLWSKVVDRHLIGRLADSGVNKKRFCIGFVQFVTYSMRIFQ